MTTHADQFGDDDKTEIAEIRRIRQEISARFDHDPSRLVTYIREQEKVHGDKLVRAPEQDGHTRPAAE